MRLTQMRIGQEATIKKVRAPEAVKNRLYAMGIAKGNPIRLLDHTLKKETWEVEVQGTRVALRREEAEGIEVE